jgi:pyruvate dehydrogenase E1 component beta subunit
VIKTNRAVIVDESKPFCGVSSQIITLIQEYAFDHLDAPVKRVCTIDAPAIYSKYVENDQLPNAKRIVAQVLTIA